MRESLDLDRYLGRIAYGGSTTPTYETLAGLVAAHTGRVPFENLDVLLGRPIRLDLAAVQDKVVRQGRGGYCFEQATLFAAALEALGFALERHTARVVMFTPRDASPRTHMFLVVPLPEGTFVVDPGFGSLVPRVPVPLAPNVEARFGRDVHWFEREDRHWTLRMRSGGKDADCWTTTLDADCAIDFEVANHYTSTHPSSGFVNRLTLRAFTPVGRVTVANRDATIVRGDQTTTFELADRRALRELLTAHFGFDLPEVERLRVPSIAGWT
jgi:N-hydroxyarylamine O-acetyltransferase